MPAPKRELTATVPKICVYLNLPFKGELIMTQLKKRIKASVQRTFMAADFRLLTSTIGLPLPPIKIPTSITATSHCIYKFTCSCQKTYIGRTDRCLIDRIKEHVPQWLAMMIAQRPNVNQSVDRIPASSIGKHLLETGHVIDKNCSFEVIFRDQKPKSLMYLEAIAISRLKPQLCVQKKLFITLKLPWGHVS